MKDNGSGKIEEKNVVKKKMAVTKAENHWRTRIVKSWKYLKDKLWLKQVPEPSVILS